MHAGSVSHTPKRLGQRLQGKLGGCRVAVVVEVGGVGASISPLHRAVPGLAVRPAGQAGAELPPKSPFISTNLINSPPVSIYSSGPALPTSFLKVLKRRNAVVDSCTFLTLKGRKKNNRR